MAAGFLASYMLLSAAILISRRSEMRRVLIDNDRWITTAFLTSYFGAYLTLYAFYSPIANGPRLALALSLPSLFCMMYFASLSSLRETPLYQRGRFWLSPRRWHYGMLGVLSIVVVTLYPYWIQNKYTGH